MSPNNQISELANVVIGFGRRRGFGLTEKGSKREYSVKEMKILSDINNFLKWFSTNECSGFRTKEQTRQLIRDLFISHLYGSKMTFIGLFCPSYNKESLGFNRNVGKTTIRGINNLFLIHQKANELGFNVESIAAFGDIALENFDKLKETHFMELEASYSDFIKNCQFISPNIKIMKLSELGLCNERIGKNGIKDRKPNIDYEDILSVAQRSEHFYLEVLKWDRESLIKRTEELACTYHILAEEIKEFYTHPLIVFTENIYERGRLFSGETNNTIPIFYPKKDN